MVGGLASWGLWVSEREGSQPDFEWSGVGIEMLATLASANSPRRFRDFRCHRARLDGGCQHPVNLWCLRLLQSFLKRFPGQEESGYPEMCSAICPCGSSGGLGGTDGGTHSHSPCAVLIRLQLQAVRQRGAVLAYAAPELQDKREVVFAAVSTAALPGNMCSFVCCCPFQVAVSAPLQIVRDLFSKLCL